MFHRYGVVPALCFALLSPGLATAQWHFLPLNAAQNVQATNWYVAHDTGNGLAALSALANGWTTISPAGSTFRHLQEAMLVTQENPTTLRGWSAFRNSTATQTVSASFSFQTNQNAQTYGVLFDSVPATQGVLRAYSAYTNTWASLPLASFPSFSLVTGAHVAVQLEGLNYHAYSAHTGQWATLTVPVAGGLPFVGVDYVGVDLRGTNGPFQYAAFSALRGTWSLSPTYPTTGADRIASANAGAFAIRTDLGAPASFRYAGYSPVTGQWVTSSLVHSTASAATGTAFRNGVRIQDTDPAARFELFGAGNGVWQALTGANLQEQNLYEDFHVVRSASGSSCTVYAASTLVGGGYTSVVVPTFFPGFSQGTHEFLVTGNNSAWGYSAATNAFAGPVAQPAGSGVSQGSVAAVGAFNVQGSSAPGLSAMAFTARHGTWVAGPATGALQNWTTYVSNSLAVAIQQTFPGAEFHVFDEHKNQWLPPVVTTAALPTWGLGPNCFYVPDGTGTYTVYSVQRGDWTVQAGFGAITSPGGGVNVLENLLWFTDSNNRICVFSLVGRAQVWHPWPLSNRYATSGAGPGSTPSVGVSARGSSPEYGLLYAALSLPPAPLSIPGVLGTLDLAVPGAVQIADLGLFDADGVREVQLQFPGVLPEVTSLWFQLVTVNLVTGQIAIHDRATGATLF
ncbi:MAG: hypothetical protein JNK15_05725 [Planctomycetes bacterium]|nr:hypothetical protein [Planctomycetota bacterium]